MQLLPVFSSVMPTLLAFAALARAFPRGAMLALLACSWLIGQVCVTVLAYVVACSLVGVASPTLEAAHRLILVLETAAILVVLIRSRAAIRKWGEERWEALRIGTFTSNLLFLLIAALFSYFLFSMQLYSNSGFIYRSRVYWDFTAHYPIVQNFVFGDNFPARDETAAELPLLYHFFSDLQVAQYVSLGTSLTDAFLFVSVLSLVSLLILVKALAEDLFQSRVAGWMSAILVVTSSNLRWLFDSTSIGPEKTFFSPFVQARHPMTFSNVTTPVGDFNFSMFNLFYFIEERHVIFASALLIAAMYLKRSVRELTMVGALLGGVLLSLFCNWNFFLLPMFLLLIAPGMLVGKSKRAHVVLAVVLCTVAGTGAVSLTRVIQESNWFQPPASYPLINFSFASPRYDVPISLGRFFTFYGMCMGPTLLCACIGGWWLWRNRRDDFWLFIPVVVGTFILINSVQAMATSIYENHKWVKPWQQVVNVLAVAPFMVLRYRPKVVTGIVCGVIGLLLTASGIAEAVPFFYRLQDLKFAPYPSTFIDDIRSQTKPHDAFVTMKPREILLAGRRVFYLNNDDLKGTIPHLRGLRFKFPEREKTQRELYATMTVSEFCRISAALHVQVVEFSPEQRRLPIFSMIKDHVAFEATPFESKALYSYVRTDFCSQKEENSPQL